MTSAGLSAMSDLHVQISTIEEKWDALKARVAEGLGVASMKLLVDVEGVMDGFADFLNADSEEERAEALAKIRENLTQFFTDLGAVIQECIGILRSIGEELQNSDDPVTKAIGDILVGLTNALQWMIDNQDKVKLAFEAIFGLWLLGKLAAVAGSLGQILMQIEAIKAFKGINLAGAGGAGIEAGATSPTAAAAGGGLFSRILGSNVLKAAAGIGTFLWAMSPDNPLFAQSGSDDLWDENGNPTDLAKAQGITWNFDEQQKRTAEQNPDEHALEIALGRLKAGYGGINAGRERERERADAAEAFWDELRETGDVSRETRQRLEDAYMVSDGRGGKVLDEAGYDAMIGRINELLTRDNWWEIEDIPGMRELPQNVDNVMEMLQTVLGNEIQRDPMDMARWDWLYGDHWSGGGSSDQGEGITSSDLQNFNGLPAKLEKAAKNGTAAGVSNIRVYLDGAAVGRLIAGTVSQEIAKDLM